MQIDKSYAKKTKSQIRSAVSHGKRMSLTLKLDFLDIFSNSISGSQEIKWLFHFKCYSSFYHISSKQPKFISPNVVTMTSRHETTLYHLNHLIKLIITIRIYSEAQSITNWSFFFLYQNMLKLKISLQNQLPVYRKSRGC